MSLAETTAGLQSADEPILLTDPLLFYSQVNVLLVSHHEVWKTRIERDVRLFVSLPFLLQEWVHSCFVQIGSEVAVLGHNDKVSFTWHCLLEDLPVQSITERASFTRGISDLYPPPRHLHNIVIPLPHGHGLEDIANDTIGFQSMAKGPISKFPDEYASCLLPRRFGLTDILVRASFISSKDRILSWDPLRLRLEARQYLGDLTLTIAPDFVHDLLRNIECHAPVRDRSSQLFQLLQIFLRKAIEVQENVGIDKDIDLRHLSRDRLRYQRHRSAGRQRTTSVAETASRLTPRRTRTGVRSHILARTRTLLHAAHGLSARRQYP